MENSQSLFVFYFVVFIAASIKATQSAKRIDEKVKHSDAL